LTSPERNAPLFAATRNVTVLLPVPDDDPATVIQGLLLIADHAQLALVEIATVRSPPPAPTVASAGAIE
jgi:hypothetical protein